VRTNCLILALAAALGMLPVAAAQNYPPPYYCYENYYCYTSFACLAQSGACVYGNYSYVTALAYYVGFCQDTGGEGCNYDDKTLCVLLEQYSTQANCTSGSPICYSSEYWEGCQ
jgi:hypothetical protein